MKPFIALLFFFAGMAQASCPQFFKDNHPVQIPNSVELCNSFFVVEFDTVRNAPIISAEKFRSGGGVERTNNFHADIRLDKSTRATPSDYSHSGFDLGHMTPAGDSTTPEEMSETFLVSNMSPQQPTLNRKAWRLMEMAVRKSKPDYIITGNFYSDKPITIGTHKVPVPVGYYKIVWNGNAVSAYCANNEVNAQVISCSLETIEKASGLIFH